MKNLKLKSYISSTLCVVLCWGLAFSTPQLWGAPAQAAKGQKLSQPMASDIDQQRRFVVDTQIEDLMLLTHQTHQRIKLNKKSPQQNTISQQQAVLPQQDAALQKNIDLQKEATQQQNIAPQEYEVENYSLTRANVLNSVVSAPTDLSKLQVFYTQPDAGKANGRIEIVFRTNKFESRHIIHGFDEFTSPPPRYSVGNLMRFATTKGLYALPLRLFQASLFKAPVPVLHLLPAPPDGRITGIQVQHLVTDELYSMAQKEQAYQHLLEKPFLLDNTNFEKLDYLQSGDIVMRIENTQGEVAYKAFDHADETFEVAKRLSLLYWWASLYDPGLTHHTTAQDIQTHHTTLQNIQKMYTQEVRELFENHALSVPTEKRPHLRHNLIMKALAQISRTQTGLEALQKAVPQDEQGQLTSILHQAANQKRQTFTLQQQERDWYKHLFEKPQHEPPKKIKARLLNHTKAWGEQVALRLKPSHFRQMSRTMQAIVGVSGAGLLAGLGGEFLMPEAFAYLMHQGLQSSQNLRSLLAQVPFVGVPFQEQVHLFYVLLGAATVGSFLRLAVALNGVLVRSNYTRSWPPFRKFYRTALRSMGTLNFPFQALLWEKLGKQKIIYNAFRHGLTFKDMPWNSHKILGHTVFKTPAFLHSPFATDRQVRYAAHKINRHLELKTLNSRRAGFLAGLALVSQQRQVDVATLLIQDTLDSPRVLDGIQDTKDWVALNLHLSRLYQWLHREYKGKVDPAMVRQSYQHYNQLAKDLTEGHKFSAKLKRLWQASKVFFVDTLVSGGLFGNPGYDFSLWLKNSDPNQRTTDTARMAALTDYEVSFFLLVIFLKTGELEMTGRLFASPANPNVWQGLGVDRIMQAPQAIVLGGEQVALGASGYVSAEQKSLLEDLKEQHHRPLTHFYFQQKGESRAHKQHRLQAAGQVSDELFAKTGVPYTEQDRLLKEKNYSLRQDLGFTMQDIKNGGIKGAFAIHAQMIKRLIGPMWQGQIATMALFLSLGLLGGTALAANVSDVTDADFLSKSFHGALMGLGGAFQIFFLKHTFLGYTQVWPYVYYFSDLLKQKALKKASVLEEALFYVSAGIRVGDRKMTIQGVRQLLTEYQEAGLQPEIDNLKGGVLNLDPTKAHHYSNQEAALLFKYALAQPPAPTQPNSFLSKWLLMGGVGVVGSTALAFKVVYERILGDLQEVWHSQGTDAALFYLGESMLLSIAALAGTWGILQLGMSESLHNKLKQSFNRQVERLQTFKASCRDLLRFGVKGGGAKP